ncbi:hypothetical protein CF165_49285 [Amycolatopsis vastitatis]|uniref:Uncharacterized protein n=1 Tax=Amycolatopsis vastitatis TaxID=1905142 RepID=A0A229SKG1_9PSEU|nr:hypothetical protein CF165_49285 [Amycolatopsis vastitatis]
MMVIQSHGLVVGVYGSGQPRVCLEDAPGVGHPLGQIELSRIRRDLPAPLWLLDETGKFDRRAHYGRNAQSFLLIVKLPRLTAGNPKTPGRQ